jgi:nucleoside-triphosphatase
MNRKNILITGTPGIGKTTLIRKLAYELRDFDPVGFYTEEIRERGVRKGFELVSLPAGKMRHLSHVDIKSPYRVGKYRVDIKGFNDFLESIDFLESSTRLIIIDEIGKMECFSEKFEMLIKDILSSNKVVIATVALKGEGLIAEIKRRSDIALFEITHDNRDTLVKEVLPHTKTLLS